MRLWHIIFLYLFLSGLMACEAGSGEGLNGNGRPLNEVGSSVPLTATLESLQANLFNPNCAVSGCHSGGSAPLGLALDDGQSYANLVSRSSVQQPGKLRISPGDSANSYIVQKVEGSAGISGNRMPRDRAPLQQSLIDALKLWIDNGALIASSGNAAIAPVVSSSSILNNAFLSPLPASITILFSLPMDPVTLENSTISLQSAGSDAGFSEGNEADLIVQPSLSSDGLTLTIDLSANSEVGDGAIDDVFRLILKGSGAAVVRSNTAQVLDGDNSGSAGGDFISSFTIQPGLLPTFSSLEDNLFVPNCAKSGCHSGSSPAAGMNLEAGNVFASIVNVQSGFIPSIK